MVGGIFLRALSVQYVHVKKNYQHFIGCTIIVEYTKIRQGGL